MIVPNGAPRAGPGRESVLSDQPVDDGSGNSEKGIVNILRNPGWIVRQPIGIKALSLLEQGGLLPLPS